MKFLPEYSCRKLNGVYIIKNDINDKIYIGECKNFYKRYSRHKSALKRNKHQNIKLQNFVNKYGIEHLTFDVLEIMNTDNSSDLIEREIFYIKEYNSVNNGFNIILDSRSMEHITLEQRKETREKLKGIKRDEDFCNKVKIGVRAFYDNVPIEKRRRAKWSEERKEERRQYIKEHPEIYINRGHSSGNKLTRNQGRKCASKINEQIAYLIKLSILEHIGRKNTVNRWNITDNIYKDIQQEKTWKHVKIGNYENRN